MLSNAGGFEPCRRGRPLRRMPERLVAPLLPGEQLLVVWCLGGRWSSSTICQHPTAVVQLQREAFVPDLAAFDEAFGLAHACFGFALHPQKVTECTGQFRQWKRFEQDMADSQLPGPLTDFSGWVPGNQHKMAVPVLADGIEHLKAFHVWQAVIEHHHIG